MAITALTGTTQAAAINYTFRTSGTTDWSGITNNVYFYDLVTKLPYYKNSVGDIFDIFTGSTTGTSYVDTYVTGFTYSSNTFTIKQNQGQPDLNVTINSVTGLTINGNLNVTGDTILNGLTANTISATTYQNLPLDVYVTGGTYNNNTFTYTNNTGGTFDVSFNSVTGLTINGDLNVTGNTILNNLSANTISATTYQNLPLDVYVTGGTYSSGTAVFTNNTGGTFNVTGFTTTDTYVTGFSYNNNRLTINQNQGQPDLTAIINTFTGLTINGNLNVTGSTTLSDGLTANTISATTYQNLPLDVYVTGGTYSSGTATFTNNTGGTFNVTGFYSSLTYFTESGHTSTPNTTTPVVSFSATSAATNIDFAILPKGNGAILANIPDNGITGGNKRGQYAVDLQMSRTANIQVASGNYSVVLGQNNRASAANGVAIGLQNVASGAQSVAIGYQNTSSQVQAVSVGYLNTANGGYSFAAGYANTTGSDATIALGHSSNASASQSIAIGRNATSSGVNSTAIGYSVTASGTRSFAFGSQASTFSITGRQAFASGNLAFSEIGSIQSSKLILGVITTTNTINTLVADYFASSTPSATNQLVLQNNNSIRYKGTIVAKQSLSTNTAAWDIDGLIVRGANAASTTLIVNNVSLVQNTPAWATPTLSANTTTGCLAVTVSGASATTIRWVCNLDTTEIIA